MFWSSSSSSVSSCSNNGRPVNHGMLSDGSTTLSPSNAEMGNGFKVTGAGSAVA